MSGTIICALDDSDGSVAAVHVARRLAERFDARMLLVSIADGFHTDTVGPAARQARIGAERRLQAVVAEQDLAHAERRVAAGDPAEAVAVIAAEEAAELIVVGARLGVLGRMLLTSFARELAATAPCPVVVAPPESADPAPARAARPQPALG
ncbi:MAG TPA: universal stress protein [Gaiellaceae bacterium]|jgi:nucleotide-binding universal stress UspA family protein|nr:universal stress protein [Gaiellaceae bacterium]